MKALFESGLLESLRRRLPERTPGRVLFFSLPCPLTGEGDESLVLECPQLEVFFLSPLFPERLLSFSAPVRQLRVFFPPLSSSPVRENVGPRRHASV